MTGAARNDAGPLRSAAALALATTVSLGLARFAYALQLPAMRTDLGWSYFTAGAMNTVNAAGYLIGALLAARLFGRFDDRRLMLLGCAGSALLLAAQGLVRSDALLFALRLLLGATSAVGFVGGGLLATQLAGRTPERSGLVLGVYYGGAGVGIVASALLVAPLGWAAAWLAIGAAALVATAVAAGGTRGLPATVRSVNGDAPFVLRRFGFALAGYLMFGLGYIGYMTFIVTLLREQGLRGGAITGFYVLLGCGVVASPWLWARLLQRQRGGRALALLNGLLAVATALPVVSVRPAAVFASGLLFGAVFLSVVASTSALVRHNVAAAAWPAGIAAFTTVFAAGQIVGPSVVGWIADGAGGLAGGLARGLAVSAAVLLLGALLAALQKPLADGPP